MTSCLKTTEQHFVPLRHEYLGPAAFSSLPPPSGRPLDHYVRPEALAASSMFLRLASVDSTSTSTILAGQSLEHGNYFG